MNKLKVLIVVTLAVVLNSCYTQHQYSYTQDHMYSHYRNNFVKRDNGGCGWHRQQPTRVENKRYVREW